MHKGSGNSANSFSFTWGLKFGGNFGQEYPLFFSVVRYSCDVTDAMLMPLPITNSAIFYIAFMRQADNTFPKRYCAIPAFNATLSLIG
jgi:hypothetical protein